MNFCIADVLTCSFRAKERHYNVKWLVQDDVFDKEFYIAFKNACESQNIDYIIISVDPILYSMEDIKQLFPSEECVVFYGNLNLSRDVKKYTPWIPGSYLNLQQYECYYYYPYYYNYLLNKDSVLISFGDLKNKIEFLFNALSSEEGLFIRPSTGFKLFTGNVVNRSNWEKEIDYLSKSVDSHTLILVSSAKNIQKEWRLVVSDTEVIASSLYLPTESPDTPQEVVNFGNEILSKVKYRPDPIWIMDICSSNDKLYLLELNSFSSSGLYCCNLENVVKKVSVEAFKEWSEYYG